MHRHRLLQVFIILAIAVALYAGLQVREPERRKQGRGRLHQHCKKILSGDLQMTKNVHTAHDRIRHRRLRAKCRYHMQAEEDCRHKYKPANGTIHSFHDNFYGWVVNMICYRGYELKGRTSVICYEELREDEYPRCQIKDCGHPSYADNTTLVYNTTTYGSRLTVKCDEGFNLSGSAKSKCLASGVWSNIAKCERKRCPEMKNPAFGVLHNSKTADGIDTVVFECAPGYTLDGHDQSSCRYGRWTYPEPRCLQKTDKRENSHIELLYTCGIVLVLILFVVCTMIILRRRLNCRRKRSSSSKFSYFTDIEEKPTKLQALTVDLDIHATIDAKTTTKMLMDESKMHLYENLIIPLEELCSKETEDKLNVHNTMQGTKQAETNSSGLETNDMIIGELVTNHVPIETVCKEKLSSIPKEIAANVCLVTPLKAGDDCIGKTAEGTDERHETGLETINTSQDNATAVIPTLNWHKLFCFLIPKVCTDNWKLFAINLLGARLPHGQSANTTISRIENSSKTQPGGEKIEVILYNILWYWKKLHPSTSLEDIEHALGWSFHEDVLADMKKEVQNFYVHSDGSGQETSLKNPELARIPELDYRISFQRTDMSLLPCFDARQDTGESHVITPVAQEELLTCDYKTTERHGYFYRRGKQDYRMRRQYSYPPFRRLHYKYMYKFPRKSKIPNNKIKSKQKQEMCKTTMAVHPGSVPFTEKDIMCVNLIQRILQLDQCKKLNKAEFRLFTKFMLHKLQQTCFVGTELQELFGISFEDFMMREKVTTSRNGILHIINTGERKVIVFEEEWKILDIYVERMRRDVIHRIQDADRRFLFLTYDGNQISKEYLDSGESETNTKLCATECLGDGVHTSQDCQSIARQTSSMETDSKKCESKIDKRIGLKRKLPVSRSTSYDNSSNKTPQQATEGHTQHGRRYFCKNQADTIEKVFRREICQGRIKESTIHTKFYDCPQLREAFGVTPNEISKILVKKIADRVRCFIRNHVKKHAH